MTEKNKACPHCGEQIAAAARKCHICGEWTDFRVSRPIQLLLSNGTSIFLIAGLVIYGLARVAHDSFYDQLHVTAEEAGLSQTVIVTRAALYSFFSISISAAFLLVVVIIRNYYRSRRHIDEAPIWDDLKLDLLSVLLGLIFVLVLAWAWSRFRTSFIIVTVLAIITPFLMALVRLPRVEGFLHGDAMQWIALALLLATALAFLVAKDRGGDLARRLTRGDRIEAHKWELLALNAEPVCVDWIGSPPRTWPKPDTAFMRLGEADGTLVLYDFRTSVQKPLRIPISDVTLIGAEQREGSIKWACPI